MKVRLHPVFAAPVLESMPPETKRRIRAALRSLALDPTGRTVNLDVKRLDSNPGQQALRLRVGDWRIGFTINGEILVLKIFHRDEGYGWLADLP